MENKYKIYSNTLSVPEWNSRDYTTIAQVSGTVGKYPKSDV